MRDLELEDDGLQKAVLQEIQPARHEIWFYKWGALILTLIAASVIWVKMIGAKQFTPRSDMVLPATAVLETGIKHNVPVKELAHEMQFQVKAPDLRQLGGKLTKSSSADFGGEKAIVMHYQYGKSDFLLYRFQQPSKLFDTMKKAIIKGHVFFFDSGGAVTVVAWKDKKVGYYALAAKATEKDLLALADKMLAQV